MFLPYHCPTFRTDHLQEPCTKNYARALALEEAKKHIGPLEKCVECKGKALITKPLPEKTEEYASPERKGWEPHPEVTTAPIFLKDVPVAAENRLLSPYPFIEPEVNVTRKPSWPEMRELSPEKIAAGRKAGHNLGKKYKKKEKILPELPTNGVVPGHDHGEFVPFEPQKASDIVQAKPEVLEQRILEGKVPPKQEEPVPAVKITEKEAVKLGIVPAAPALEARYCKTHPEMPQQIDKLGRWMGMCAECLSARGKKCGIQNAERGITAAPMSIPLNMPKWVEMKEWLAAQAEENERTMTQQIMFVLKTAWRQGI